MIREFKLDVFMAHLNNPLDLLYNNPINVLYLRPAREITGWDPVYVWNESISAYVSLYNVLLESSQGCPKKTCWQNRNQKGN